MLPLRVAVIGAGRLGPSFALECARAGFSTVLEDVMPHKLRRAGEQIEQAGLDVELASTVEAAVREADIAIDFVPDELESKLEIFSLIDRMAPPKTIICTPTGALSITDLASCTYRSERCAALRGLSEKEVTLVRGETSSNETVALVTRLLESLGRSVRVEADTMAPMLTKNL
ncbi:3-hydroxyacyl-CoA dehydrogenase [Terriglobus albidus]|uniref:3-hydroxyacyl-CoA dehydrogenase n=1 Tax=Terriglobus albidus TaxID=1592106 RepID=A0A5B9EEE1_9BACT|nr:3-hydroxyacyl-CoA dehydrogenase NAD-binding domain-containing protein [Terriglobus albidus]QEE28781.1 3-hydroxyacyl-CoA dehydrogenase [Terriglobus albidus]